MTVNTDKTKQALAASPETKSLEEIIKGSAKEIAKSLPTHLRPERVMQIALTCIRLNPELAKCSPASFLGALFVSAQLGIEPVAGNAYILPFNNNRKVGNQWIQIKEAQFLIGYKGLATLFYRHEKAVQLNWGIVHTNDDFEYEYGTKAYLRHRPVPKDRGTPIGYYVIAGLQGGGQIFKYMTVEECMEHGRKHSKTYDKKTNQFYAASPWAKEPDAMCLKTVLIQLAKLLPLSIELQRAISADETAREYRQGIDNAMDLPVTTEWSEPTASEPVPSATGMASNGAETAPVATKPAPTTSTPAAVIHGTITDEQKHAINQLGKKIHGATAEAQILERIGGEFGVELLAQLSTEQGAELIRELSKEAASESK
jgi:recombination protein RecT